MNDDLISRQVAIEKAEMLFKTLSKETVDMMGIGYNHAIADNIAILKNLPSAEPQIVHCGECKHWHEIKSMELWTDRLGKCDVPRNRFSHHAAYHERFYCGDGERRADDE